jgi:hypothetical protein
MSNTSLAKQISRFHGKQRIKEKKGKRGQIQVTDRDIPRDITRNITNRDHLIEARWKKYNFLECLASLKPHVWYCANGSALTMELVSTSYKAMQQLVDGKLDKETIQQLQLHSKNGECSQCGKNLMLRKEMDYLDAIRSDAFSEMKGWRINLTREEILLKVREFGFFHLIQCPYCLVLFERLEGQNPSQSSSQSPSQSQPQLKQQCDDFVEHFQLFNQTKAMGKM